MTHAHGHAASICVVMSHVETAQYVHFGIEIYLDTDLITKR